MIYDVHTLRLLSRYLRAQGRGLRQPHGGGLTMPRPPWGLDLLTWIHLLEQPGVAQLLPQDAGTGPPTA